MVFAWLLHRIGMVLEWFSDAVLEIKNKLEIQRNIRTSKTISANQSKWQQIKTIRCKSSQSKSMQINADRRKSEQITENQSEWQKIGANLLKSK